MIAVKTPVEMDRIRAEQAKVTQQQLKDFVPEAIEYDDKAHFIVSRCVKGPAGWVGLWRLSQVVQNGKKPWRTVIVEGVDMHMVVSSIRSQMDKKLNERKK